MRKGVLKRASALLPWVLLLTGGRLLAEGPSWWTNRNVLTPAASTNDFAAVNMGQLKWIATNACAELDGLPGGRGSNLQAILNAWLPDSNNYAAVNVGQLKYISSNVWRRLIDVGYTNALPWTNNPAASDYVAANIGQVKKVFAFDIAVGGDSDGDGLADTVETGTGIYLGPNDTGTDPNKADTDGDGIEDGDEVAARTDPNSSDSQPPTLAIGVPVEGCEIVWKP